MGFPVLNFCCFTGDKMDNKKSLVLIDAYSQIYRAFYAIRMLTNSRGEPVNAAFVFTKFLLQLEKNHPSAYGAMLFDCGKVPFRLELNPEYKANRPPMPDPLKQQIPLIKEIAGAFGWEQLQCEGFEADDLIGGMALKYQDFFVEIVSSDKDLSQLIDERISMLIPGSSGGWYPVPEEVFLQPFRQLRSGQDHQATNLQLREYRVFRQPVWDLCPAHQEYYLKHHLKAPDNLSSYPEQLRILP